MKIFLIICFAIRQSKSEAAYYKAVSAAREMDFCSCGEICVCTHGEGWEAVLIRTKTNFFSSFFSGCPWYTNSDAKFQTVLCEWTRALVGEREPFLKHRWWRVSEIVNGYSEHTLYSQLLWTHCHSRGAACLCIAHVYEHGCNILHKKFALILHFKNSDFFLGRILTLYLPCISMTYTSVGRKRY